MIQYDNGYEHVMNMMLSQRVVELDNGILREFSTRGMIHWLLKLQDQFELCWPYTLPPEISEQSEKGIELMQFYRFNSLSLVRHFAIFNFDNGHIDFFKDTTKNAMDLTPEQLDYLKNKKVFDTSSLPLPQRNKAENKKFFLIELQKNPFGKNNEPMLEEMAFKYLEVAEEQIKYMQTFFVSRCGEDDQWYDAYMTACWDASLMLAKNMSFQEYFSSLKRFFDRYVGDIVMYYRSQSLSHWMTKDRIKAKRMEKEMLEISRLKKLEEEKK